MHARVLFTLLLASALLAGAGATSAAPAVERHDDIPLAFTLNRGQDDPSIRFTGRGSGAVFFFTREGITVSVARPADPASGVGKASQYIPGIPAWEGIAIRRTFLGATPSPEIIGEERLAWSSNYYHGSNPGDWKTDVPNYSRVRVSDLYPDIDAVCYGKDGAVKYDFTVRPGGDPAAISWKYDLSEAGALSIRDNGDLVIRTPFGEMVEEKPSCYQIIGGKPVEVPGAYRIVDARKNICAFSLGEYDPAIPLVIDPVLIYGIQHLAGDFLPDVGWLGPTRTRSLTTDREGNLYATGVSVLGTVPDTPGTVSFRYGLYEVFVMKLDPSGSLRYTAFVSGTQYPGGGETRMYYQHGNAIAVDDAGNAYVAGLTNYFDFPVTPGAFDREFQTEREPESYDGFVFKLNPSGTALLYSTYIGGDKGNYIIENGSGGTRISEAFDSCNAVAVDSEGNAYVTGQTSSADFPVTAGATPPDRYSRNAFALKLNPAGSALVYATCLGGTGRDEGVGIALNPDGSALIAGNTESSDFPTTGGAFDRVYNGNGDGFACKLSPDGNTLVYATFFGGTEREQVAEAAGHDSGDLLIGGNTASSDFPVTPEAYDPGYNGGEDLFVLRLDPAGTGIVFATFIGGNSREQGGRIDLDDNGGVCIAGVTRSADYPSTDDAVSCQAGPVDAVLTRLSSEGSLLFSTRIQGECADGWGAEGFDVATGAGNVAYLSGSRYFEPNTDTFPWTERDHVLSSRGGVWTFSMYFLKLALDENPREYSLREAVENGWINRYCQTWNGWEYVPADALDSAEIPPWNGFWVSVSRSMDLLFPRREGASATVPPFSMRSGRWYLFASPVVPVNRNVFENLNDDLGIPDFFSNDPGETYRVANWSNGARQYYNYYDDEFVFTTPPSLTPGRGFWVLHINGDTRPIDIEGAPLDSGAEYYPVSLPAVREGGNYYMTGNPYPYPILMRDCRVRVPMSISHMVPKPANPAHTPLEDIRSWHIGLGVQSLDGEARDTWNRAGVITTDGVSPDLLNADELLPPGDYIKLALRDPANQERDALSYDYREAGKAEYTWEVELTTTYSSIGANLSLSGLAGIPEGYMFTLKNRSDGTVYDIGEDMTLPVTLSSAAPKRFTLTATAKPTGVNAEQPAAFGIAGVSPNPFNPSTTVTFGLEYAGNTTVKVYTLTGQLAATLVNTRLNAGTHTVTWNVGGHASGVYFISVESNGNRDIRKVTLMK